MKKGIESENVGRGRQEDGGGEISDGDDCMRADNLGDREERERKAHTFIA